MKQLFTVFLVCTLSLGACGKTIPGPVEGAASMSELWALPLQGFKQPTLFGNQIVSMELTPNGSDELHVTAVDLDTRTVVWIDKTKFYGEETVVASDLLVSFNGRDALEVRDASGTLKKSVKLPVGLLDGSPNHLISTELKIVGDTLVLPLKRAILAYDLLSLIDNNSETPTPLWQYTPTPKPGYGGTFYSDAYDSKTGLLFASDRETNSSVRKGDTYLSAIDMKDGSPRWRKVISHYDTDDYAPPATVGAGGGLAYVHVTAQQTLNAYDATGTVVWTNPSILCPNPRTNGSFALPYTNGTVFVAIAGDHCIGAVDAATGKTKFIFDAPLAGTFAQRPLVLNNVMYATNGHLWAVDMNTGNVLGQSGDLGATQSTTGTVLYDQKRNQLLTWGDGLRAFKPLK
jgi:outer membrane protein assembly factor BamB